MSKVIFVDELDRKLMYYYRNNFKNKTIAQLTGLELRIVKNRMIKLKKQGLLKRWWEEENEREGL